LECVICDRTVCRYQLCSECGRVICFERTCSSGKQCADVESCESAQAFNRLMHERSCSTNDSHCPDCGGPMVEGEGQKVCSVCQFGVPMSYRTAAQNPS